MSADDDTAKKLVLTLLQDKTIAKIKLKNSKISLYPDMYAKVADAIQNGKISVLVAPGMLPNDVGGRYYAELKIDKDNIWYDVLVLRSSGLGEGINAQFHAAALIVHECTHAAFDLLKIANMTHLDHEAGAYIAAALFTAEKMLALKGDPKKVTQSEPIEAAAWAIALLEIAGKPVPKQNYNDLNLAIGKNPEYKATATDAVSNDGVGRPWLIGGKRQ